MSPHGSRESIALGDRIVAAVERLRDVDYVGNERLIREVMRAIVAGAAGDEMSPDEIQSAHNLVTDSTAFLHLRRVDEPTRYILDLASMLSRVAISHEKLRART